MADVWRSTARTWCKHCKTYYRATPFDEQQHNNTPKHQGAVQRAIRNLHKDNEREQREKQRAKEEIARLNGITAGASGRGVTATGAGRESGGGDITTSAKLDKSGREDAGGVGVKASESDRKRQMAQLAEMGVAIPKEFRREMAIAGDWEQVSIRRVDATMKDEETAGDHRSERSIGVRKRRFEEEREGSGSSASQRPGEQKWGCRKKTYKEENSDVNIGALIGKYEKRADVKMEEGDDMSGDGVNALIKKEERDEGDTRLQLMSTAPGEAPPTPIKHENAESTGFPTPVIFKKRKGKVKAPG